MILTALLLGAVAIAGVGIAAAFWNDLVAFLKRAIEKVQAVVAESFTARKSFSEKSAKHSKKSHAIIPK